MRPLPLSPPPTRPRLRIAVGAPDAERDLPVDSPDHSPAENAAFRDEIAALVYWDATHQPPRSASSAALAIAKGEDASAREAVHYGVHLGVFTGPTTAVHDAFWKVNEGWRRLEAWAGAALGADVGAGPLRKDTIGPDYRYWLRFSRAWKDGSDRALDLHGITQGLQHAEKVASQYGYPGVYHPDRREEAAQTGYGSTHWVSAPSAEDQSVALSWSDAVDQALPNVQLDELVSTGAVRLLEGLPTWVKVAGAAVVAGAIITPIVVIARRVV